jgi:pimeloyl-ACP methyl ester carboxylesterase
MPELSMGGAKISYTDQGRGEALVLLHGWIGSGVLWSMVAPWLSERYRVIVPDLPGHGDSAIPDGFSFTLEGFTTFLEDLRVALELSRLSLVGHSMGGSISIYYAAKHQDVVEKLVLIDTPGSAKALIWPARIPGAAGFLGLIHPLWGPGIVARLIKSSVRYPEDLPPDFLEGAVAQASLLSKKALKGSTRLFRKLDLDPELPGVKAPTLIIYGDKDPSVKPDEAKRLHGMIPNASLQLVPDCGHCPNYEYPDLVVGLVEAFMGDSV